MFPVAFGSHQARSTRKDQPEVHRYELQVWTRSFPDRRRQVFLHGNTQEGSNSRRTGSNCRRHRFSCSYHIRCAHNCPVKYNFTVYKRKIKTKRQKKLQFILNSSSHFLFSRYSSSILFEIEFELQISRANFST